MKSKNSLIFFIVWEVIIGITAVYCLYMFLKERTVEYVQPTENVEVLHAEPTPLPIVTKEEVARDLAKLEARKQAGANYTFDTLDDFEWSYVDHEFIAPDVDVNGAVSTYVNKHLTNIKLTPCDYNFAPDVQCVSYYMTVDGKDISVDAYYSWMQPGVYAYAYYGK